MTADTFVFNGFSKTILVKNFHPHISVCFSANLRSDIQAEINEWELKKGSALGTNTDHFKS